MFFQIYSRNELKQFGIIASKPIHLYKLHFSEKYLFNLEEPPTCNQGNIKVFLFTPRHVNHFNEEKGLPYKNGIIEFLPREQTS